MSAAGICIEPLYFIREGSECTENMRKVITELF
jgi:hypothetical protein